MKRFSFNLEKLLQLRGFEEKNAKTELAAAISEAERIKLDLRNTAAERVRINKTRNDNIDVRSLMAVENYVNRLDLYKEELLEKLAAAELVIEEKRKSFTAAMQKRSVLDKLKEKQFALWRKESISAEESALEDTVYGTKQLNT